MHAPTDLSYSIKISDRYGTRVITLAVTSANIKIHAIMT